jgi:hypothetical protein
MVLTNNRPGLRERFIFSQHDYCGNMFWYRFVKDVRILWQYEVRDCYTRNVTTNEYNMSHGFTNRISDLNSWSMGPDFFQSYPELRADIPAQSKLAPSLPAPAAEQRNSEDEAQDLLQLIPLVDPPLFQTSSLDYQRMLLTPQYSPGSIWPL